MQMVRVWRHSILRSDQERKRIIDYKFYKIILGTPSIIILVDFSLIDLERPSLRLFHENKLKYNQTLLCNDAKLKRNRNIIIWNDIYLDQHKG